MNIYSETYHKQTLITFQGDNFLVTLSTLGASLVRIKYKEDELIYYPINKDDMQNPDYYYGKTIGPICNRIKDGIVHIDGKEYRLSKNEGNNTLHGGYEGISNKYFDYSINDDESSVTFIFKKKSREDGLPGNVIYKVKYVIKEYIIDLSYDIVSDENTMISLTNHTYICLKDKDVKKFLLRGDFDKYVVPDKDDLLPIKIEKVPYYLNFKNKTLLGNYLYLDELQNHKSKGFDHNLIFKNGLSKNTVLLEDSTYILKIETNFPSVQIYSDNYKNPYDFKDILIKKYASIAIEPCDVLLNREVLEKGKHYMRKIKYSFKNKNVFINFKLF